MSNLHLVPAHSTYFCHTTFGVRARHCIFNCPFVPQKSKQVGRVSSKVSATSPPDSSCLGHIFNVRDNQSVGRFLIVTFAQRSVIYSTAADRLCLNPSLSFQAVNTYPAATFGTCSFSLNLSTGLQPPRLGLGCR
ncbi:hypothetical protein SprV_0100256600 [Sparganum proliferum]